MPSGDCDCAGKPIRKSATALPVISPLNVKLAARNVGARAVHTQAAEIDACFECVDAARPGDAVDDLPGLADIEVGEQIAVAHREIAGHSHRHVTRFQRRQRPRLGGSACPDALKSNRLRIEVGVGPRVACEESSCG